MTSLRFFLYFLMLLTLSGCKAFDRLNCPPVQIPAEFCGEGGTSSTACEWWEEFNDPALNDLVEQALACNLELAQAWDRLLQARAQTVIDGSPLWPEVNLNATVTTQKSYGQSGIGAGSFAVDGTTNRYALSPALTYEVDLFGRLNSRAAASRWNYRATIQDLEATALVLSGTVTELWFTILEQQALLDLLRDQIQSGRTFLELVELRFSVGESSALDVYQQRVQLAATEAEVPTVRAALATSRNQLSILLGEAPKCCYDFVPRLPHLPPLPQTGNPCELLLNRPDLKASYRRLRAADREVWAAIADRFPKFTFLLDYERSALAFKDIFNREVTTIMEDLALPLFDAGRRAAEVRRRKAITMERFHFFGQGVLIAIGEVEDALIREKELIALIAKLHEQDKSSKSNLNEATMRYAHGLSDYLTVIAAIQSLQNVERRIITEEKNLLVNRSRLYRALGGTLL